MSASRSSAIGLRRRKRIPLQQRHPRQKPEAVPKVKALFALGAAKPRAQERANETPPVARNVHRLSSAVGALKAVHFVTSLGHGVRVGLIIDG